MARMIQIDSRRLSEALKKRGLEPSTTSKELGYDRSYLGRVMRTGSISNVAVSAMAKIFNIQLHEIIPVVDEPKPEENVEEKKPETKVEIDYSKLCQCIYKAVLEAIKQVERERGKK